MKGKRKAESSLKSEPSRKINRLSTASDGDEQHRVPPAYSSPVHDEADLKSLASPPAPLTRANLELLAKMTNSQGPKSNNNTTTASDSQTKNSKESRVSITDPTFEPKLRQNGVQRVTASYRRPPVNLDEMERRLRQSRKTASPTPEEHLLYSRYFDNATNKRDIENALGHFVLKQPEATLELSDTRYVSHIDKQWVDFPKDVGLNNQLSAPKPDRVEGFAQDTFPPDIDRLGGAAMLVKNNPRFVALPHFVGEFKDFGGDMRKAQVQAAYDGAAMVYARNEALKLVQQPDPERTAAPITVTSDGCDWKTYVHYSGTNQDTGKLEYYQYGVASGSMLSYAEYKEGRRVLRNAQDLGRELSADMRERLQQYHERQPAMSQSLPSKQLSSPSASLNGVISAPIAANSYHVKRDEELAAAVSDPAYSRRW